MARYTSFLPTAAPSAPPLTRKKKRGGFRPFRSGFAFRKGVHLTAVLVLFALILHLVFMVLTTGILILYRWVNPPLTGVMAYRTLMYRWKAEPVRFVPLERIPSGILKMTVTIEDGYFYRHRGIRMDALKNAWRTNRRLGRTAHGGSTITMQTARTLFLCPEKSYIRKYLELIIALEMEAVLPKDRILELYLNYAEWGRGIYGVGTAATHYYQRQPSALNRDESIRLVALLSSPILYSPETVNKSGSLAQRYRFLQERY